MKMKYSLIHVVALFAAGLLFATSSEAKIDLKTVAGMWLFDEDEGDVANDSSGNGNNGNLTNSPDWDDGKFGSALVFDGGAAYVNCGNEATLDITQAITVVAWAKFNVIDYKNSGGGLFTIAAKGHPDAQVPHAGWWFSYDNRDNNKTFRYTCFGNKNGGWSGGGNNMGGSSFDFTKGDWYHIAFTIGGSIAKLYVDGVQVGADKTLVNLVLSDMSRNLTIGSETTSYPFNGAIDEVAVFNVALAKEDIQKIMNQGLERACGLTAVDVSGKLITIWASIKSR